MLLNLARGVFEEQTNLDQLIKKIMLDAQGLLKCERCSVYLIDDTLEGVSFNWGIYLHLGKGFKLSKLNKFGFFSPLFLFCTFCIHQLYLISLSDTWSH